MAESIFIDQSLTKKEKYDTIYSQIVALTEDEPDLEANLCNIMSALKYGLGYFWVGVYKVDGNDLVLGPFQGTVACTRIPKGKGVCGDCWEKNETIIVPNVDEFPGHIACSSASKSEIVIPVRNKAGEVAFVLDVDSDQLNDFDSEDARGLQRIVDYMESLI